MNKHLIYLATIFLLLSSCKQDLLLKYGDKDRLQFGPEDSDLIYFLGYETKWKYMDTLKSYSFYFEDSSKITDTLYFDLYTLGRVVNYDRPFQLVQVNEPNSENAIPGVHFQAFEDNKSKDLYVVKAGLSHVRVPIIFFRDSSLKERPYTLFFRLSANEHFDLGAATNIWRKAIITDRLIQPRAWTEEKSTHYWGKYSVVKHQFMINVTGLKWDQPMMENLEYDLAMYYKARFGHALIQYNNEHPGNPLRENPDDLNSPLIEFPL